MTTVANIRWISIDEEIGPISKHKITKKFFCLRNSNLISLQNAPIQVLETFHCTDNQNLVSLVGCASEVGQDFSLTENLKLESLVGGPTKVGKDYMSLNANMTSIEGIATLIGNNLFLESKNVIIKDLWKLPYLTHIGGAIYFSDKQKPWIGTALNKYKNGGKVAAFSLQQELIELKYY